MTLPSKELYLIVSVAVIKHNNQGSLQKEEFIRLTVPEW